MATYRLNHLTAIKELLRTQILDIDTEDENDLKEIPKQQKVTTIQKTFELWQQQRTIAEIAEVRKLSAQTITQHIGKLISEQKIDITEVLSKKIAQLQKLFKNNHNKTLTEIKAEATEDITWNDLRIFKASTEIKRKIIFFLHNIFLTHKDIKYLCI